MPATVVDRTNFDSVVLQGSARVPVLVDFWAPWCAPCRALAPVLEKLASEFEGRMTLAKVDTDREPEIAGRYGIRGIPNCKLFVNGEVVDEFTGALPEGALRNFLAAALPSPAAGLVQQAKERLAQRDAGSAMRLLDEAGAIDADDEDCLMTRIDALLAQGRAGDAGTIVEQLESTQRSRTRPLRDERRLSALKAQVALASEGGADLAALARAAAATPVDCAAKLAHARALAGAGDYEQALAELLGIVQADRAFGDDAGRRTMLTVFAALPPDSDLVRRYRRELAAAINR